QKSLNRSGAISVSRTVTLSAVGAALHPHAKPLMLCGSLTLTVTIPTVLDTRVRGAPARAGLWVEGNVKIERAQDGGQVRRTYSALPALSTTPRTQASPARPRQIGGALVRAA